MTDGRLFGSHVSVAGGLHNALIRGAELGCDCVQIFVRNQRQWTAPALTDEAVAEWKQTYRKAGVKPVVAHGSYLVNLASPDDQAWERSIAACGDELARCDALGVMGLVMHPGAHMGSGVSAGIARIASALDRLIESTAGSRVRVLLETTAGQGSCIGHEFGHLSDIIASVKDNRRLGVCVDTAHIFAAGYDLRTQEAYGRTIKALVGAVGLRRIRCLHLNDSKTPLGSRVDRHEHIGRGKLGGRSFRHVLGDVRLAKVPGFLETPKGTDTKSRDFDVLNLARLRRLAAG